MLPAVFSENSSPSRPTRTFSLNSKSVWCLVGEKKLPKRVQLAETGGSKSHSPIF